MLKKKAFIVPDTFLYKNGCALPLTDKLDEMGIVHTTFFNVAPDPTLACAKEGVGGSVFLGAQFFLAFWRGKYYIYGQKGKKQNGQAI
jgi:acetaldehyde dehydrogenase/alcohol dehydrogenase